VLVPALPSSVIEPVWDQFAVLIPEHIDTHPLGCHNPRIPDRTVFDKLVQVLVLGASYERIADSSCSATTIRNRRDEWIAAGVFTQLEQLCLEAYDKSVGLDLSEVIVDGCIVKAPCGGEAAGRSPVDRGKQGTKRSLLVEADGGPLSVVIAGANVPDFKLLEATLDAIVVERPAPNEQAPCYEHLCLDKGYDKAPAREIVEQRGYVPHIRKIGEEKLDDAGVKRYPARRWVVERTLGWLSKCRAILVRYDKKAANYLGLIKVACILLWYRRQHRLSLLR
jgi:transposase